MNAPVPSARSASRRLKEAGFSMMEAVVAVGIITVSLGAMMTLNGQQLRLVKLSKDVNSVSLYQQERVEQLRQLRWPDLTNATFIAEKYLPARPRSASALNDINETLQVAAFPNPTQGSKPLKASINGSGTVSVDSTENGFALTSERLVRVNLQMRWKGADGRPQARSMVTLISNSGITRSNLPAMGPVAGGPYDNFSTPAPSGSATPAPAPDTSLPTDPTTDTSDSTKKNDKTPPGRGNTGGKNGGG